MLEQTFNFVFITCGVAFLVLWFLSKFIFKQDRGNSLMIEIASAIEQGSKAFLKRQYKSIFIVGIVLAILLLSFLGFVTMLGFIVGAIMSGLCGYLGMLVSIKTNSRVANIAKQGLFKAFDLATKGGAVTGILVATLGLLSVTSVIFFIKDAELITKALIGLGFGASLISVFARLGGGIYTKAADVGADLVGKVEAGIPEDDPRNPATIADNVGDNVGDCAGMAADLFETYVVTIISAILLGRALSVSTDNNTYIYYPLVIGIIGLLSTILGVLFIRLKDQNIMPAFYKALIISYFVFSTTAFFVLTPELYLASMIGIIVLNALMFITDYYTSYKFRPVKNLAKTSTSGHATNIIEGIAISLEACALPTLIIVVGIWLSYYLAGLYGIAFAVLGMLSMVGLIITIDAYGPITDNAGGIAEMAHLPQETREVTDHLDAVGNTTKAVTKGYAIGSAALASLVLFSLYVKDANLTSISLENVETLIGLFIGGLLPYLFASYAMRAVGNAAQGVVTEVRRQFKEIPGIMEYKTKPDYSKCVDVVTKAALKEMIVPSIMPVVCVVIVGFLLGKIALSGLLIGSIISGLFVAVSMTTGGAAWDNAKKYIEKGNYGGKGSLAHAAAVTGDTVGDPYKDTAGPAINPMIKVINIVALLIVGLL